MDRKDVGVSVGKAAQRARGRQVVRRWGAARAAVAVLCVVWPGAALPRDHPGAVFSADVVGPGDAGATPFVHAPTITVLPSGDLAVAWYGASHHRGRDAAVYGSQSSDGGRRWSAPVAWADTPGFPEANPVLFRDPQDRLWLFYSTRLAGWAIAWVRYRVSSDAGRTWSSSRFLTWVPGYLLRGKPLVLADGSWLLPAYHEEWGSRFLRSEDQGASWAWSSWVLSDPLNIQPAAVELAPGRLLALMRNRGPEGMAWMSRSADGGQIWDPPTLTQVRNPDSALDLIRLRDGTLALAYNDARSGRQALAVALSEDQGRSWFAQILLEGCGSNVAPASYPSLAEGPDGTLHVVYAVADRRIKYARLDPGRIAVAGRPPARCEAPAAAGR